MAYDIFYAQYQEFWKADGRFWRHMREYCFIISR